MQQIGNCPNCGYMLNDTDKTCPYCGKELFLPVNDSLEYELNKFNWGAFLVTWIWGIGNKVWISLIVLPLILIPKVGIFCLFFCSFWLGFCGNKLAWENNKWEDIEQFKNSQIKWTKIGIIITLSIILMQVLSTGLFLYFLKNIYLK